MYCISLYLNIFCAILVKCVLLNRSAGTGRNKRLERYTNIVNQILTVMIRVHDGHAECCLDWNVYDISVNCEFYMKYMQKMNVVAKINCYFRAMSLQWNCAKNI